MQHSVRTVRLFSFAAVVLAVYVPHLPWGTYHRAAKVKIAKYETKLARWDGVEPRPMALGGKIDVPGATMRVLGNPSGWAVAADAKGRFELPGIVWFPGSVYQVLLSAPGRLPRQVEVFAPWTYPENGALDLGEFDLTPGGTDDATLHPGDTSVAWFPYDLADDEFFKRLFRKLSKGKRTDGEILGALNDYTAGKRTLNRRTFFPVTPRVILESTERWSYSCGELSLALAMLAHAGGYKVRTVTLMKPGKPGENPYTHSVVEVFHDREWHLFDPTYANAYRNPSGDVASYRDIRLDTDLLAQRPLAANTGKAVPAWMPAVYDTGLHHHLYLR